MQAAIEVWGHLALFTRPEYRMERVSYDVITPSAAQGLLKAIYWHPGVEYQIDYIQVLSPIRRMSIKTNEVTHMTSVNQVKAAMMNPERVKTFCFNTAMPKTHTPRVSTYLKDVRYIIHFTTLLKSIRLTPTCNPCLRTPEQDYPAPVSVKNTKEGGTRHDR